MGAQAESAARWVPERPTLSKLRNAAADCEGCGLYRNATQTVFGEGPAHAEVMLVGEQPGDREDIEGAPFVGPAGRVLDEGLERAGIDRSNVYVTNAVKHFKFERKGKRRIHKKPNAEQIRACRPWLDAELGLVSPRVVVCLGATAAQALLGPKFSVMKQRGQVVRSLTGPLLTATVHPSSILRASDDAARKQAMEDFVSDLKKAAAVLKREPK